LALTLSATLGGCGPSSPLSASSPTPTNPTAFVPVPLAPAVRVVDFEGFESTADVRALAGWAFGSNDTADKAFAVVDKRRARLYVFAADGRLAGTSPVLVGLQPGDETEVGIGDKPIADIRPDERTTPAGRFVTIPGMNAEGKPVVWIDYDAAVSMHAVIAGTPAERRLQRLASADPAAHRISYGCINVPTAFFNNVAAPTLAQRGSTVYILPDVRPLGDVFPALAGTAATLVAGGD
jgi:hypothetical protein